jgi:L-alanine-DL-glutamate epimerase-like enolase superfamily enzyme
VKISDVRIVLHASPARGRLPFGVRTDGKVPLGVLVIETDEGLQGTDFIGGPGPGPAIIGQQIVSFLKPLLVGRDPLEIGALWQSMPAISHKATSTTPIAPGSTKRWRWCGSL